MIIDVITLILTALAVYRGYSKGLVVSVFSLLAVIIGLAAALKLSATIANWLGTQVTAGQQWIAVLSFVIVLIAVGIGVRFVAGMVTKVIQLAMLGWVNVLGGIVFYVLLYMIVWSVTLFYLTQLHIITPNSIANSVTYNYIAPYSSYVINGIGKVIPIFQDLFGQLQTFFEQFKK